MQTEIFSFSIGYEELGIENFIDRYHFDKKDKELVASTGRFLTELVRVEAGICYLPEKAVCAVTLGTAFDQIAELTAGHLLLSYCIDCYGMEFLSRAYEKLNEHAFEQRGKWIGTYHFLGEENEEELQSALKELGGISIVWGKGMLHPLKSVVFMAEYKGKREESGCDYCRQCGNVTCNFRKNVETENKKEKIVDTIDLGNGIYSYGISNIFGTQTK